MAERTKVKIHTPGASIEIESDGDLAEVSSRALELFAEAGGWPKDRGSAIGFREDRRPTYPAAPSSMRRSAEPGYRIGGEV